MSDERTDTVLKITSFLHRIQIPPKVKDGDVVMAQRFKEAHKKAAQAIGRSRVTLSSLLDALNEIEQFYR